MSLVPTSLIASTGLVKDSPAQRLPLHAWTDVRNAAFSEGYIKGTVGRLALSHTKTGVTWLELFSSYGNNILAFANNVAVFASDNTSITDITRVSGPYTGD